MTPVQIEWVFNLLVHICVLWWFLVGFFFLYVRHIESEKIYEQLDGYIGQQVRITLLRFRQTHSLSEKEYEAKLAYLDALLGNTSDEELSAWNTNMENAMDAQTRLNNQYVLMRALMVGLLILGVTLLFYAWFHHTLPLKHILIECAMVFTLIGCFEFYFFTRYGLTYEPVDPNEMLRVIREYKAQRSTRIVPSLL